KHSALKATFLGKTVAKDSNFECPRCKDNSWIRYPSLFLQTVHDVTTNISSILMDQDEHNHSVPSDDGQEQVPRTEIAPDLGMNKLAGNIPAVVSDVRQPSNYRKINSSVWTFVGDFNLSRRPLKDMGLPSAVEDVTAGFDACDTKYTDHGNFNADKSKVIFEVVCTGTINHHPLRRFRVEKYYDKQGMRCSRNEILINTDSIGQGLATFRTTVDTYFKTGPSGWMKRIETDFSLATIAAVIHTFWNGHNKKDEQVLSTLQTAPPKMIQLEYKIPDTFMKPRMLLKGGAQVKLVASVFDTLPFIPWVHVSTRHSEVFL
ncbi:unnamed protein product, partial [Allacma fusca]